jgi:hypothetical protein
MDSQEYKASRGASAVQLLRRLDDIGAIKLDVLLSKSAEIKDIVSAGGGGGGFALSKKSLINTGNSLARPAVKWQCCCAWRSALCRTAKIARRFIHSRAI